MKRAFTLLELLVVIGIMGLLGTASIGGYRAMRRGMEEKGVMQTVNSIVKAAYQRAQIDRQPTAIFFWNETVRGETADENAIVVGHAVAVRRSGRLTRVQGSYLYDEFGDLELTYPSDDEESGGSNEKNLIYLYAMDDLTKVEGSGNNIRRSSVEGKVYKKKLALTYLTGTTDKTEDSANVMTYVFNLKDRGGVDGWKSGMAYGFEFTNIELPQGYIFGQNYSKEMSKPILDAGVLVFDVGLNKGNGMSSGTQAGLGSRTSIAVYSLRPDTSGNLSAQLVGNSESPTTGE